MADDLRAGDYLAFTYGLADVPAGHAMRPVQVEHPGRVEPVQGYVWGKVGWVTEQLWRSFPVVAEKRTVWVFCEFGNQSSIITMVPRAGMVVIRRLPL